MGWGTDEFAKYQAESGGNIYLVRGQDGYGQVNRQSRVVGFKTTDQINSILEGYKVEKVLVENRLFGYPLTVHRVVAKHGLSLYAQGISVGEMQLEDGRGVFALSKNFPESVAYHVWRGNDLLTEGVLDSSPDSLTISDLPAGLSRYSFAFYVPDDTVRIIRDAFVDADDVALLSTLPMVEFEQDWGEPQMDESVEHHTLRINGESFRFGIGSHANSRLLFSLPKDFEMLHAVVGLDDESACGDGAEFVVWTDGKPVWRSRRIYSGESLPIQVKIRGARSLELRLDRGGDKNCDHGDWANAWLSGGK